MISEFYKHKMKIAKYQIASIFLMIYFFITQEILKINFFTLIFW
jgi:hypothetical protein